jgi:hypothetical protein
MAVSTEKHEDGRVSPVAGGVVVLLIGELTEPELVEELRDRLLRRDSKIVVVVPAVEKSVFHHALGDVDTASREARQRLDGSLSELKRHGIAALGQVGDSDPVVAAEDALREYPADEVLIVAHSEDQARWYEAGLFERAQEALYPAVQMVTVRQEEESGETHVEEIKQSGPGRQPPADASHDLKLSPNLPRFTRGDLAGILIAIVGTIVAIVLAAGGPGTDSGAGAAQVLIAMAVALINMAHVVGLTLLESVRYRGGWQRFLRNLSLIATPSAIVANLLLTLFG